MKRTIITVVILGLVGYGWYQLRHMRVDLSFLGAETVRVGRADLTIPISATGEIRPRQRIEIKPEASGRVAEIPVNAGSLVNAGDLILKLDPLDEQRSVDRARNDVERGKATLEQQRLRLKDRQTTSLAQVDAQIMSVESQVAQAEFDLNRTKDLFDRGVANPVEMMRVQSQYDQLVAQRDRLRADRKQAEIGIELAEQEVKLAENALSIAETNLSDALERLRETEIDSPIDGMVVDLPRRVGEVVQSGVTTFTGGTLLAVVADVSEIFVQTEVSDADIGAVMWLAPMDARPGGEQLARELAQLDPPMLVDTSGVLQHTDVVGQPVTITVDACRGEEFYGIIDRVYPEPRKAQNIVTYLVDIKVTSPNWKRLTQFLGMQADVEFTAKSVSDALLVPHDAIRKGPTGELGVYIAKLDEEKNEPRPHFVACRFGLDNGLYAELLEGEGIERGTEVYTKLPAQIGGSEEQ